MSGGEAYELEHGVNIGPPTAVGWDTGCDTQRRWLPSFKFALAPFFRRLPASGLLVSVTVGGAAGCRCPPNQTLNGAGEATDEKELRFAQPDPFSPQERSPTDPDVYGPLTH